ncbi:MAG: putative transposase [Gammaproteobacteria bacterium]|jgi:transposase-like protein|nr:putative transposase [Gammaproteobacteria bacterium]
MGRRHFNREFKLEAVKLVKERGVSVSQAARDLGIGASVVGRWVREIQADKTHAFPKPLGFSSRTRHEVRGNRQVPAPVALGVAL